MTIEEKIDNFRALLKHSYQAQKKDNLVIHSEILEKNEFDIDELEKVICPSLVEDGCLLAQPSFLINPGLVERALGEGAVREMDEIYNELVEIKVVYNQSLDRNQKEALLIKIRELENKLKSYIVYEFIVDKDKLTGNVEINATQGTIYNQQKSPEFDSLNGVIRFGAITHVFQKSGQDKKRLCLFKLLWNKREVKRGEKIKRQGESVPSETIAVNVGMIESSQMYTRSHNANVRKKFREFIKSINNNLRRKGFPIKIEQRGGVRIVIRLK